MAPVGLFYRGHLTTGTRYLHHRHATDFATIVAQCRSLGGLEESQCQASATTPPLSLLENLHSSLPRRDLLTKPLGTMLINAWKNVTMSYASSAASSPACRETENPLATYLNLLFSSIFRKCRSPRGSKCPPLSCTRASPTRLTT